jgi:hypothetical protein
MHGRLSILKGFNSQQGKVVQADKSEKIEEKNKPTIDGRVKIREGHLLSGLYNL